MDPEALTPASRSLLAVAEHLARLRAALAAQVASCAPRLHGQAAASTYEAGEAWSGALRRLGEGYAHLAEALGRVEAAYRAADSPGVAASSPARSWDKPLLAAGRGP